MPKVQAFDCHRNRPQMTPENVAVEHHSPLVTAAVAIFATKRRRKSSQLVIGRTKTEELMMVNGQDEEMKQMGTMKRREQETKGTEE